MYSPDGLYDAHVIATLRLRALRALITWGWKGGKAWRVGR
jgi:hypothetical protein